MKNYLLLNYYIKYLTIYYMSLIISTITNNFFPKIDKNPAFNTCPNGNILVYETIINLNLENIENIYIVINRNDIIEYFY